MPARLPASVLLPLALFFLEGCAPREAPPDTPAPIETSDVPEERFEVTLPEDDGGGMESRSWNVASSTSGDGISAAGQIFRPPEDAPYLFSVGFHMATHRSAAVASEVAFQMILSEWEGDRPGEEVWQSATQYLYYDGPRPGFAWQEVDVPEVLLNPDREYVAWVTVSDLGNPPGVQVSIVNMGPKYSGWPPGAPGVKETFAYRAGRSAFFREPNPDGVRDAMTLLPWEVRERGHNLHFQMWFANRP